MHGRCIGTRHDGMTGIVIGCRRRNTYFFRHGTYCTANRCGFLDIKPLRNEAIADPKTFGVNNFIDQVTRAGRCAGKGIES